MLLFILTRCWLATEIIEVAKTPPPKFENKLGEEPDFPISFKESLKKLDPDKLTELYELEMLFPEKTLKELLNA